MTGGAAASVRNFSSEPGLPDECGADSRVNARSIIFEAGAIVLQIALALTLRATAWPEVTTPAYLWSRGLLMYRDIKFVHTPGMMGLLALAFHFFGAHAAVIRSFALIGPLAAHGSLLAATRGLHLANRVIGSVFFLSFLYGWQGNSVWPVPLLAGLAIPVAIALERGRFVRAALLIGTMIVVKQTSAYLLLVVMGGIVLSGRLRRAAAVAAFASLPYFAAAAAFGMICAGPDYFRWTLVVPFATARSILSHPSAGDVAKIGLAFMPLIIWTFARPRLPGKSRSGWLLATAAGLAMIVLPRFDFMEAVAAVPCLALGAARWMEEGAVGSRLFRRAAVATFGISFASTIALGETFDGRTLFWDSEPALRRLVGEIRTLPPAPLVSNIWENVLPQTGRLPPGRLYVHPWLYYYAPFDDVGQHIVDAARKEHALIVSQSRSGPNARRVGPYWIETDGAEETHTGSSRSAAPHLSRTR